MLKISQLFIYPVKSLGGIAVPSALLTDRGLQYDRRWMLVDEHNRFLTQRVLPQMALFSVTIHDENLQIKHHPTNQYLDLPFQCSGETFIATVWGSASLVQVVSEEANKWFSETLGLRCRLVYMPDEARVEVESPQNTTNQLTSLSDGYPLLVIGQSSLDDLNSRLEVPLPMNRFRPNIVFTGGYPYQEDDMEHFRVSGHDFYGVKPCIRCVITTIDQRTAAASREPLKTLATYRRVEKGVYFGQNVIYRDYGFRVSVGDSIETF